MSLPVFSSHLVGHEVALRLLRRAMATGDVAHAYLLTGMAGVGKHRVEPARARRCALLSQGCPGRAWSLAMQPQALSLWEALADLATPSPTPPRPHPPFSWQSD